MNKIFFNVCIHIQHFVCSTEIITPVESENHKKQNRKKKLNEILLFSLSWLANVVNCLFYCVHLIFILNKWYKSMSVKIKNIGLRVFDYNIFVWNKCQYIVVCLCKIVRAVFFSLRIFSVCSYCLLSWFASQLCTLNFLLETIYVYIRKRNNIQCNTFKTFISSVILNIIFNRFWAHRISVFFFLDFFFGLKQITKYNFTLDFRI